ncbi:MAG: transposase, partial [Kosmotogaceae bacterium]|nr:transposase [Kosmotogaceae bacterium]
RPLEECELALNELEFGLDVVVYIGEKYLQENKSIPEIHKLLTKKFQMDICEKTVGNLLKVYLALCHCVDADDSRLQEKLEAQGGIVLTVDGVQFDDRSPILYIIRDAISGEVLYSQRSVLRREDDLVKILQKVKDLNIPILGIVTDKEKGLVPAIQRVFPDVPYQWCQFHYLENLAKPIEEDLKKLGQGIREGINAIKKFRKKLLKLQERIAQKTKPNDPSLEEISLALQFCEILLIAAKTGGKPPLDPSALKRYYRLLDIRSAVRKAIQKPGGPWRLLDQLRSILTFLDTFKSLTKRLERRVNIIRKIAHILKMESNSRQVRRVLRTYLNTLKEQLSRRGRKSSYHYFVEHVIALSERYWEGLFHCYDHPQIPATNNQLESEFGATKRSQRKVTGRSSTAGGLMESAGEFVFKARSLLKYVSDLADRIRQVSNENYKQAMKKLRELQEPARRRRSFQRSPELYLDKLLSTWLEDNTCAILTITFVDNSSREVND